MDVRKNLHINIDSPYWEEALRKAQVSSEIPEWLTKDYLSDLEKEFVLLGDQETFVFQALCQVVETPELCLLAKILYHIIGMKKSFSESFSCVELPKAPEGLPNTLGYDYVGLFPILAHVRPFCRELEVRGVAHDIIYNTITFLRLKIKVCSQKAGRPCFDKAAFSLFPVYVYTNFLWFSRLRFEIHPNFNRNVKAFADGNGNVCLLMCGTTLHASGNILGSIGCTDENSAFAADFRETEAFYEGYAVNRETRLAENIRTRLPKKDWRCILRPGDTLLKVHIPSGSRLLRTECEADYERARQVFAKCYPEYDFKGFICNSWLLCPSLAGILKKDSNIVLFQENYHIFPAKNTAAVVFLYVFGVEVSAADEVDFVSLPEENSLQRGVKKLLLEGGYVHQFNGFIIF